MLLPKDSLPATHTTYIYIQYYQQSLIGEHSPPCYERYNVVYPSLPSREHHAHSPPSLPNVSQKGHMLRKRRSLLVLMTISHLEEMPTMPRSTSTCDTKGIKLINRMYKSWKQDPKSVHISWAAYFGGLDKGMQSKDAFSPPPSLSGSMPVPADGSPQLAVEGDKDVTDYLKVRHRTIFYFINS